MITAKATADSLPGTAENRHQDHRPRVVLLGASNLTKCISRIVTVTQRLLGHDLDIFVAAGHGRSYGESSRIVFRSLPSILDAGLWSVLERSNNTRPTYGLITDIGNDIMFGASPDTIESWVDECLQRLAACDARVVMTALPMSSIRNVSLVQYYAVRTAFFPSNTMTRAEALQRCEDVNTRLHQLAEHYGTPIVEHESAWYGLDPIHIRSTHSPHAWRKVLSRWLDDPPRSLETRFQPKQWLRLRTAAPQRRWLFGVEQQQTDPTVTLDDDTTVHVY